MFNVGSVQGYLKLNTMGWNSSMRRSTAQVTQLSRTFTRMGVMVIGSLVLIEREFGKFDKAIRHATSVSETSAKQFEQMSEMALDASVKWNKAATETAQAFYFLGSAGLTVTEQMHAFNDAIMLSRAMGSDLAQTVEGLVDIVRAFGLEFENVGEIADQITKTIISSNQQFHTLSRALSYAASTAALTNNTFAETTAMLGVMANAGIKGSMAGTVLRRAMTNLMAPTGGMAELIYELGLNIYDTAGKMVPFIQIMGEINDKLVGVTDEYKNLVFETLFGRRAIAGQIVLFNYGSVALRRYADEIENAAGITERVAGKQMKAFTEVLGQLWREMQRVAITVGDLLAPAIERVANRIRYNTEEFREYIKVNKESITATLKWTAALSVLAIIGPPIVLMLASLVTQFGALAIAMLKVAKAGLLNPFTLILISLYTLRAVLKKEGFWGDIWSGFTKSLDWVLERTKSQFKTLQWYVYKFAQRSKDISRGMRIDIIKTGPEGEAAREALFRPWGAEKEAAQMERFSKAYDQAVAGFADTTKAAVGFTVDIMAGVVESVGKALAEDIPAIIAVFTKTLTGVSPTLDALLAKFKAIFAEITTVTRLFMQKEPFMWGLVFEPTTFYNEMYEALTEWYEKEMALMRKAKPQTIWEKRWTSGVTTVVKGMQTWRRAFSDVNEDMKSSWAATIENLKEGGGSFKDFMEDMFTGVLDAFNRMVSKILADDLWWSIFGQGIKRPWGTATLFPGSVEAGGISAARTDLILGGVLDRRPPSPLTPPEMGMFKPALGDVVINIENTGAPVNAIVTSQKALAGKVVVELLLEEMDTNPNTAARIRGG